MKRRPLFRTVTTRLLAAWLLLALVGCAGRETIGNLATPAASGFSESGDEEPPNRWWETFDDADLNAQINVALDGNYTLAVAMERLRAAKALTRREASDLLPDLDGFTETFNSFGPGDDAKSFEWGLEASYQVDLWGQIESRVDAERIRASATQADYHAVALTLSAEIARNWFSLIESYAQLELLDDQIETNQTGQKLQEARFALGLIRSADVLRQRQLVESTLEQVAVVQSRIELLEHELAVLQGRMPQDANYDTGSQLPDLHAMPATGLPSELLQRRPDVRREYLAFVAADRDVASAISAQYPRISLSASLSNVTEHPEDLFRDWFVSIGSQLVAPLFDGGQRRAEVERTAAVVRQRFNEYGETMLIAFREVEDALARERNQRVRLEHLQAQVELAQQSSDQLREQYLIGDTDYLSVLTAITAQQRLQRETLSAQLELILIRISLHLSLAGDFDSCPTDFGTQDSGDPNFGLTESDSTDEMPLAPHPDAQDTDAQDTDAQDTSYRDAAMIDLDNAQADAEADADVAILDRDLEIDSGNAENNTNE
ncbi:TolC family protein [Planctomycetes bacterium K23_9]|uniref:Toluene efflux pump outer membrane protein TtgI n=1 Tax=Stieleria marina TaxID=1930275 RepID=A0A517NXA7_9BACT|nr:Toluene efflux pump outer membrane protein TtgI precursor [Planctomycetes bacterium K23_9]